MTGKGGEQAFTGLMVQLQLHLIEAEHRILAMTFQPSIPAVASRGS